MSNYTYHFDDARMKGFSENFESRIGDNTGHEEQEHFENVHMLLSLNRDGSCLDVGAGMGRMTSIAREMVSEVVALEPDESRWRDCHAAYHREPDCLVYCQTTGDYMQENPGKKFDLIIVSMVIQHLSTGHCQQLLSDVSALLKPGGAAIVFTTHALEKCKGFSFSADNSRVFVPQEEFDAYANSPISEQKVGLPVHRFSKQDLLDAVEAANLAPVFWRQTSYFRPDKVAFFANRLNVEKEELSNVGNCQFVVVQKKR